MTESIVELLCRGGVLLDGGMGSSLIASGLVPGSCPELWNHERPESVRGVHEAFLRAGSDVVQTNTFGANAPALARHRVENRHVELNLAAARIAREAIRSVGHGLVAGNVGPTGLSQPHAGRAIAEEWKEAFTAQASALAQGGVDYFSLETFSDLEEVRCAMAAIQAVSDLPITACLTFEREERGVVTLLGERPGPAFEALVEGGACAVGANCSTGSDDMLGAMEELLGAATVPLVVKPNAGLPEIVDGRPVYGQDPQEFAAQVSQMASLGAGAVGGCCGTNESFIACLRRELDSKTSG
jgi:5-methyltetrahydrofolate--homocysteine methyltransferase